jgi:hypothetical protein
MDTVKEEIDPYPFLLLVRRTRYLMPVCLFACLVWGKCMGGWM